ncbi:MAG: helix-turn-helix domain-containing protein [Oscillospiraceae bacterium]|nr:helix-turn-helix domain-containing protein [Clostridia bacterium]MBP3672916.1 helix-turn-helix domain-containing protein [Oscillospiraceae bacterium]
MKSLDYKKIAKRLKARRTALGMTYQELADKASMSKSTTLRERSERIVRKKSVLLYSSSFLSYLLSPGAADIDTI